MQKRHSTTEMATPAKAPSATMIIFALIFANVIVFRNDCQLPHLNSIVVRDKPTILFPINHLIFSKKSFFLSPVSKCDAREGERGHIERDTALRGSQASVNRAPHANALSLPRSTFIKTRGSTSVVKKCFRGWISLFSLNFNEPYSMERTFYFLQK